MGNEERKFYEEMCKEYESILKKSNHSLADVEKFNAICKAKKNLEMAEQYSQRSYDSYSNRGMSRGYANDGMSNNSYQGGSFTYSREQGYSDRMSRDGSYNGSYMSNHSIVDRLISVTENLMDEAGSDFERKVLRTWINRMRTEGYNE